MHTFIEDNKPSTTGQQNDSDDEPLFAKPAKRVIFFYYRVSDINRGYFEGGPFDDHLRKFFLSLCT